MVSSNAGSSILIGEIMQELTYEETCNNLKSCHHAHNKPNIDDGHPLLLGFKGIKRRHLREGRVAHESDAAQSYDQISFSLIRHGLLFVPLCTPFALEWSTTEYTAG